MLNSHCRLLSAGLLAAALTMSGGCSSSKPLPTGPQQWRPDVLEVGDLNSAARDLIGSTSSPGNAMSDYAEAARRIDPLDARRVDELFALARGNPRAITGDTRLPFNVEEPLRHGAVKRDIRWTLRRSDDGEAMVLLGSEQIPLSNFETVARAGYVTGLKLLSAGQNQRAEMLFGAVARMGQQMTEPWDDLAASQWALEVAILGARGMQRVYQTDGRYQRQLAAEDFLTRADDLHAKVVANQKPADQ